MHSGVGDLGSSSGSVTFSISLKAQAKTASELSKSMETMRGHLQAQLRCKEAENSRLCMQIKVPAGPMVEEGGGRGLQSMGGGLAKAVTLRKALPRRIVGSCCQSTCASERLWDTGEMGPGVLGVLPSSRWAGFHGPEPVTLSLRPSVLLKTHGEEGRSQMLIVSVSQGPSKVTVLLIDRDITGEFSHEDPMGSVTQGGAVKSLGRARVSSLCLGSPNPPPVYDLFFLPLPDPLSALVPFSPSLPLTLCLACPWPFLLSCLPCPILLPQSTPWLPTPRTWSAVGTSTRRKWRPSWSS